MIRFAFVMLVWKCLMSAPFFQDVYYATMSTSSHPEWYFNFTTNSDHTQYQHVPTKVLPPSVLPPGTDAGGFVVLKLEPQDEPEHLVKVALRTGLKMTVAQIDQTMIQNKIAFPAKGTGSGKNGYVNKVDKCRALVKHFFKDSNTDYQDELVEQLCGAPSLPHDSPECPEDLVDIISHLDVENANEFKKMIRFASELKQSRDKKKEKERQQKRAAGGGASAAAGPRQAPAQADDQPLVVAEGTSGNKWRSVTPPELRGLLPGRHSLPYVYLKHLRSGNRLQGVYQCEALSLCANAFKVLCSSLCVTVIPRWQGCGTPSRNKSSDVPWQARQLVRGGCFGGCVTTHVFDSCKHSPWTRPSDSVRISGYDWTNPSC